MVWIDSERALEVEFVRQVGVLEVGGTVQQQTMLWDGAAGAVRPSRTKEGSHDYRYFPEPDLPPLVLTKKWIAQARRDLPELPSARRARFAAEYALGEYHVEVLTASPHLGEYYEAVARAHGEPKVAANWVMGEVLAQLKASGVEIGAFRVRPQDLARLLSAVPLEQPWTDERARRWWLANARRTRETSVHPPAESSAPSSAVGVDGSVGPCHRCAWWRARSRTAARRKMATSAL